MDVFSLTMIILFSPNVKDVILMGRIINLIPILNLCHHAWKAEAVFPREETPTDPRTNEDTTQPSNVLPALFGEAPGLDCVHNFLSRFNREI